MSETVKKIIKKGVSDVLLDIKSQDSATKEFAIMVNNASKLHQMYVSEDEVEWKKKRFSIEKDKVLNEQKRLENEESKINKQHEEKMRELNMMQRKQDQQHEERMKELIINELKAKNEATLLKENQEKAEREYKNIRLRYWTTFGISVGGALLGMVFNYLALCNQLRFERVDNGILTPRINKFDSALHKAGEIFIK